jgi:hypothetical protein
VRKITTGVITTVAGTGTCGFTGDGGAATSARLNVPNGIAVDTNGNIFIADTNNCRLRKVSTTGTITTIAGTGTCGYNGDGTATTSQLNFPQGLDIDAGGNVYIGDNGNCRVRKISGTTMTTVAGTGTCGFNGDQIPAVNAQINHPNGVRVDQHSGAMYVADGDNCRVRKVFGGIISTIAGTTSCGYNGDNLIATNARLNHPWEVILDGNGNFYIGDETNCRIRKVSAGMITTVAGNGTCGFGGDGGAATSANLNNPAGVAVSGSVDFFDESVILASVAVAPLSVSRGVDQGSVSRGDSTVGGLIASIPADVTASVPARAPDPEGQAAWYVLLAGVSGAAVAVAALVVRRHTRRIRRSP